MKPRSDLSSLHVVAWLHPRGGGTSRTVVQLTDSLANDAGVSVTLLSQGFENDPTVLSQAEGIDRRVVETTSRLTLQLGLPVRRELARICNQNPPSLIHSHGVWLPVNHWASNAARRIDVPLIVHPHGMLEPWALNYKAHKKWLAMALFQRKDLATAKVLVATSSEECRNLRSLGFGQPIAIIPNGVELASGTIMDTKLGNVPNIRTALFLSRVHQKKGLINLVHAWGRLRPQGWRIQIAGPNEGGHLEEVMLEARKNGIEAYIDYIGEVDGAEKEHVYKNAHLFVLPTFSENFGVVVIEALAHGLPVITTRGAPWADLETFGCGWWIDIGVEPLVVALREAIALSDDQRSAMGELGLSYVQRYNWGSIARHTADIYRWVLNQGPKPDCVHMD